MPSCKDQPEGANPPKVGEVGIFWFITPNEILQDSVPCAEGYDDGEFINGPSGHYEYWESLKRQVASLAGVEYDTVPRGRVIYSKKENLFLVYGSKTTIADEQMKAVIKRDFNLHGCVVKFIVDSHYELNRVVPLMSLHFDK